MTFRYAAAAAASVLLALVATACGGGEENTSGRTITSDTISTTATDTDETEASAADETESDEAEDEASAGAGDLAPGTGRVTIGDTTWDVVADIQCLNYGVALGFQGHAADDPNVTVTLDANTDDPTAASASLDVGDEDGWKAGDTYVSLGATIPETTVDDGYGTGSATFVNTLGSKGDGTYETAPGTYEFYCE